MGLDLLEKHGSFLPFWKAVNAVGELFIYRQASASGEGFTEAQAPESVRFTDWPAVTVWLTGSLVTVGLKLVPAARASIITSTGS